MLDVSLLLVHSLFPLRPSHFTSCALLLQPTLVLSVSVQPLTCLAVIPYFPYSRQSKKKAHRSAITARMLANLLSVAGVTHLITMDLHAPQMQGFFKCPVDNLVAEPLLAKWIRDHVKDWRNAVVVSKNPGGTKRVTRLADALHLSFGIITTDRRKSHMPPSMYNSVILDPPYTKAPPAQTADEVDESGLDLGAAADPLERDYAPHGPNGKPSDYVDGAPDGFPRRHGKAMATTAVMASPNRMVNGASYHQKPSPLAKLTRPGSSQGDDHKAPALDDHASEPATAAKLQVPSITADDDDEEFTDEVRLDVPVRSLHLF